MKSAQKAASLFRMLVVGSALASSVAIAAEPLPSWNDGGAKHTIVHFVQSVSDPASPNFVPEAERIAVFDNDGTLWSEQPLYFQLTFALDRVKAMAADHPEWANQQPYKAVLEGDMEALIASGKKGLIEILMTTHVGNTTDEFQDVVAEWVDSARHPRFKRPYTDLVYQPMLEVLDYLRANGFKTFIVSGGGIEFMRVFAEEVYGVPPEQAIGSSVKTQFEMREGGPVLVRLPEVNFIDDKEGKPVGINLHIGRRPIAAFGNSDGDLQMLQWTAAGDGPSLQVIVHHTDDEREWAYARGSHIGGLDKALDEASEHGWTVVDMKNDWEVIYPFQLDN